MRIKRVCLAIAILSTSSVVGGIAVSSYATIHMGRAAIEQSRNYLPRAEQLWKNSISATIPDSSSIPLGTYLGTMNIPAINKTVNIFQGTDEKELTAGVGHFLGSVLPGVIDNSVFAGHRDTVFSNLGKVKMGSLIILKTQFGTFIYKVDRIRIVDQNDRTVIVPTTQATLTLSTCYPFEFVGSAPQRYIVSGSLL